MKKYLVYYLAKGEGSVVHVEVVSLPIYATQEQSFRIAEHVARNLHTRYKQTLEVKEMQEEFA